MTTSTQTETGGRYKWVALTNTTSAVFMSALDGSIVIISLPAIFRGIGLDPLDPGNIGYLLWMIMGYRLVQAVLVVTLGRLGDMFGRVRIYNAGLHGLHRRLGAAVLRPVHGRPRRAVADRLARGPGIGGSMLTANSAAILTDAFPPEQRGLALGINQIAALAGQFLGLVAGGLLAAVGLARGVLGQRAGRHVRHAGGPTAGCARPARRNAPRADRLVGQHHLRGAA